MNVCMCCSRRTRFCRTTLRRPSVPGWSSRPGATAVLVWTTLPATGRESFLQTTVRRYFFFNTSVAWHFRARNRPGGRGGSTASPHRRTFVHLYLASFHQSPSPSPFCAPATPRCRCVPLPLLCRETVAERDPRAAQKPVEHRGERKKKRLVLFVKLELQVTGTTSTSSHQGSQSSDRCYT